MLFTRPVQSSHIRRKAPVAASSTMMLPRFSFDALYMARFAAKERIDSTLPPSASQPTNRAERPRGRSAGLEKKTSK